jgi:hypothetical protein
MTILQLTSHSVKQFLAQKSITESEQDPSVIWLFPKVKSVLKGRRFQDIEDIQKRNLTTTLKAIQQQEFQKCFRQW